MNRNPQENSSRTLRQLAVIDAWFDAVTPSEDTRYSLHMNVAFRQERLGGGVDEPVRFRVTLRRCEVVVVLPQADPAISIDPRTVARKAPTAVTVAREAKTSSHGSGSADVGLGANGLSGSLKTSAGAEKTRSTTVNSSETLPCLDAMHSRSVDGHPCWVITTTVSSERLVGSLWDPHTEPRLQIIDQRPESTRDKEAKTKLYPMVTIEIRYKREDLDITDISLIDEQEESAARRLFGHKKRVKAAEAFIKSELEKEGLQVTNIEEIFSDLVIADRVVPLKI